ncbi:NAD(P)H-binding protein [Solibacillus isronensis]|uniref:NAD(P)H-binding protein n=1 Tax=Solibacillus isronensis TaxID=412383 RepID=UPI00203C6E11|nr:NAD(P)H-binding protein [Solibacillus isronensis]MCM3722698.1 NAD(P)H-binding protein [Solibacillus isronensis]
MKTMRSALVVGATGLVGSSLVKLLCESEEYAAVNVISRRPLDFTHPKLVVKLCEFDQIADKDIEFAHEVFCCLGTTMKKAGSKQQFEKVDFEYPLTIAAIAKNRGIGHFIVISAMGANEKALAYYSKVKGKLEAELVKMDFPRLSIVRPSLITGNRQEFRLGETIGDKVLKILNPILFGPLKKMHSITATQIALAMKVIALHGKEQNVAIYLSDELLEMQMPMIEKREALAEEEEVTFNWDKYKEDTLPTVNIEDVEGSGKNEERGK